MLSPESPQSFSPGRYVAEKLYPSLEYLYGDKILAHGKIVSSSYGGSVILRFNDNQPQHLIEAAKSRPSTVILVSWAGSMNKPLFMYKRSHGMNGEDMVYIENKDEEHGYISAGGVRRLPTQKELSSIHTDVQNRICELAIVLPADSQTGVKLVEC